MPKETGSRRKPRNISAKGSSPREGGRDDMGAKAPVDDHSSVSRFARVTAPPELGDPDKRKRWGLPVGKPDEPGPYIIELNAENIGGLPGAANAFLELHKDILKRANNSRGRGDAGEPGSRRDPVRISKSYYRCELTDREWRELVATDEAKPLSERTVYRLWPDFPVSARTDRSVMTIKADAALRSFDAAGEDITWAVVDSGIDANHPHFGPLDPEERKRAHALWADSVRDLHRCFAEIYETKGNVRVNKGQLPDPDWDANMKPADRAALIDRHRELALLDDYGHGTHVAGIIAGEAPSGKTRLFERQYKVDKDGSKVAEAFAERPLRKAPRGMAPHSKLVSLRVLDDQGRARASQVIQALEYIRERINDNPKLMRVHGVNLSVGYEFDAEMFACGQSPLCTTVDRLVQEGVVVVAAAGNTGCGSVAAAVGTSKVGLSNTINDPGNAALAITVGATHRDSPHIYGVSYFSSKGPTADGRLKPDLVAPGERITSCAAGQNLKKLGNLDGEKAYYVDDTGTSMAAPHVSGAVAAFLSIRREFIGRPHEIKRIFLESATPLGRERYFEGNGLLDLMRAIQSV
jgi:subtilisin family serine protease